MISRARIATRHNAAILTEALVALMLLATTISLVGAITIRFEQLGRANRTRIVAEEVLQNELERACASWEGEAAKESPWEITATSHELLPDARCVRKIQPHDGGFLVTLVLHWYCPYRTEGCAMALASWVPAPSNTSGPKNPSITEVSP